MKKFIVILMTVVLCFGLTACASGSISMTTNTTTATETSSEETTSEETTSEETTSESSTTTASQDYKLEKMVVFSRHNMRAPTKTAGKILASLSPYTWADYTAPNGELTLLGGTQETAMGQYFRQYLTAKGLMEEDWIPKENEVRFYANSYQRTIATANYFKIGMLPVANVEVEYHEELGTMDPVFKPCLNMISNAFLEQVQEETDALADGKGMLAYMDQYADDIALVEDVIDFKDSSYAKENGVTSFPMEDSTVTYELGEEPTPAGGLMLSNSAADGLVMQYYVDSDDSTAAFGKTLTFEQWQSIGRVQTMYNNILFGLPSVAVNITHPLLQELKSEMSNNERIFTFLCGHDSNVLPLLVALGADDYTATDNLSDSTPIGCKLVWEKYLGEDGIEYCSFHMVYQASEKLRANSLATLEDPPCWVELNFDGLEKNEDGMYLWDDVLSRFDEAIAAFDALPTDEEETATAA